MNPTKTEIKELIPEKRPEDMEMLVPAYLAIWNHPDNMRFLSLTGRPFEESQVRDWFGQHLASGVRYFGAFDSDSTPADGPAGILITHADRVASFDLLAIGIRPDRKRSGIGSQLVGHGVDVALNDGYKAVDVRVYAMNAAMLCLVISKGFVPVRIDYHRGPGGEDLVHLKKYL